MNRSGKTLPAMLLKQCTLPHILSYHHSIGHIFVLSLYLSRLPTSKSASMAQLNAHPTDDQERHLSASGERICTILVNRLND